MAGDRRIRTGVRASHAAAGVVGGRRAELLSLRGPGLLGAFTRVRAHPRYRLVRHRRRPGSRRQRPVDRRRLPRSPIPAMSRTTQEPGPGERMHPSAPTAWSSSEAYVPAERTTSCEEARLPSPHVRPRRSGHREGSPPQGPSPSVCLIDRIHERAVFRRFGRDAVRSRSGPLTVVRAVVPHDSRPSAAYAISRQVGGAVVRNRLRRQLRVACSELETAGRLEPVPHLIVVRPEAAGADMTTLRDALSAACARLPRLDASADPIASGDQSPAADRSEQ